MPRIRDFFTDCAVYIYRSTQEAIDGEKQGGSGFLVSVPLVVAGKDHGSFVYAVTNHHVVRKAKTPVIRLNRIDGTTECITTELQHWKQHEDGDDIAVMPIGFNWDQIKFNAISIQVFLTPQLVVDEDVGIGDDTFMVGRFISHEGRQQNAPALRFGNIAMMNKERIVSENGLAQESFLVEVRSLPGYSGSAMFLYSPCAMNDMSARRHGKSTQSTIGKKQLTSEEMALLTEQMAPKGPYLLGIDWCHLQQTSKVLEKGTGDPHPDGWYVSENTGMAGVIPAWKVAELLDCLQPSAKNTKK